jgi:hypothetical protein
LKSCELLVRKVAHSHEQGAGVSGARETAEGAARVYSPIVELRQYTLHSGARDVLIDLFDREFIESQEALGIEVIGQFRTPDDPDRFIWLRGYRDMASRKRALEAFYGGPVWQTHRQAANATMIDSDNVLLLRPARANLAFTLGSGPRPAAGDCAPPGTLVAATIYFLRAPAGKGFAEFFERTVRAALIRAGATVLGCFVTEDAPNNFPALPVREGERVFVSFLGFANPAAHEAHLACLARSEQWNGEIARELKLHMERAPEHWRLSPTARSRLGSTEW